jgi:hypothetical protein
MDRLDWKRAAQVVGAHCRSFAQTVLLRRNLHYACKYEIYMYLKLLPQRDRFAANVPSGCSAACVDWYTQTMEVGHTEWRTPPGQTIAESAGQLGSFPSARLPR